MDKNPEIEIFLFKQESKFHKTALCEQKQTVVKRWRAKNIGSLKSLAALTLLQVFKSNFLVLAEAKIRSIETLGGIQAKLRNFTVSPHILLQ